MIAAQDGTKKAEACSSWNVSSQSPQIRIKGYGVSIYIAGKLYDALHVRTHCAAKRRASSATFDFKVLIPTLSAEMGLGTLCIVSLIQLTMFLMFLSMILPYLIWPTD